MYRKKSANKRVLVKEYVSRRKDVKSTGKIARLKDNG